MSVPDRMFGLLRGAGSGEHFPQTQIFNEGWMLRLLLDAARALKLSDPVLGQMDGATWYWEARLTSPFHRTRSADGERDRLGEGFTNADAVVGHFSFSQGSRSGLKLSTQIVPGRSQFKVLEAKMGSGLSAGTTNALNYDQAARNVACMARAIQASGQRVADFADLGFYVLAPCSELRHTRGPTIEDLLQPDSIRAAIARRIASYEAVERKEVEDLKRWQREYFLPLVERLEKDCLKFVSWEDCIKVIGTAGVAGAGMAEELSRFYDQCLRHNGLGAIAAE